MKSKEELNDLMQVMDMLIKEAIKDERYDRYKTAIDWKHMLIYIREEPTDLLASLVNKENYSIFVETMNIMLTFLKNQNKGK